MMRCSDQGESRVNMPFLKSKSTEPAVRSWRNNIVRRTQGRRTSQVASLGFRPSIRAALSAAP